MSSTVTNAYLAELTLALRILPVEVRREIHSGIAEELRGLDDGAASQRIGELGDPKYIAAAALDEVDAGTFVVVESAPANDKTWYTLTAVFALLLGGVVIPFIGWFGGVILLWNSKTWKLVDKIVGTLVLPFGGGAIYAIAVKALMFPSQQVTEYSAGEMPDEVYYPAPTIGLFATAASVLIPIATAVYLLIRAWHIKKKGAQS